MSQSRSLSAIEATANMLVGWCTALALQVMFFPVVGLQADLHQHLAISLFFTGVSLVRSYVLRRAFARLG